MNFVVTSSVLIATKSGCLAILVSEWEGGNTDNTLMSWRYNEETYQCVLTSWYDKLTPRIRKVREWIGTCVINRVDL